MKRLIIIILHFGDSQRTNNCVKSILHNKILYNEILVVNNGSFLELSVDIKKFKITIIKNKKNLGYAGGMNAGIAYGMSRKYYYFLLLNNDTIFKNNFVGDLKIFLETNKNVGITGPIIEFQKNGNTIYDLGGKINFLFGRTSHNEVNNIDRFHSQRVDYISGCCMLIKREVFEKVGLFDKRFFLYYEDVDFCLRAKKVGYDTVVATKKNIVHSLSSSVGMNSGLAVYHQTMSAVLFGKKYSDSMNALFNILFIFMQSCYIFLKNPLVGQYAFLGLFYGIHKRNN